MNILNLVEFTRSVAKESERGLVLAFGIVREGNKIHFIFQASRWEDELVNKLLDAYREKELEVQTRRFQLPADGKDYRKFIVDS